ncbi:MAG TPA: hypothetical protein VJ755_02750 [Gemmatimonadales bacterium]|nr:hypothetical protein [Gemmatimonadales bacterium]
MRLLLLRLITVLGAVAGLACGDNTGPGGRPSAELNIIRHASLAPPLLSMQASVWAKVGDGRELHVNYQGATPADTGEEFLRFEIPGDALLRKPDGSAFQPGDSILITVTVVDSAFFHFEFQPAGLVFNADHPARLRVRYLEADHDFDDDGDVDSADDDIEHVLDLWHRTGTGALWYRVGSVKFEHLDELDANILSFSEYAVAW